MNRDKQSGDRDTRQQQGGQRSESQDRTRQQQQHGGQRNESQQNQQGSRSQQQHGGDDRPRAGQGQQEQRTERRDSDRNTQQSSGGSIEQDEDERDRRRMAHPEDQTGKPSMMEAVPEDHSRLPSPGDIGAPEYYAKDSKPRVGRPGPMQLEATEEQEEED